MTSRVEISKRLVLINTTSAVLAKVLNVSVILWLHQYLLRRISPGEYQLLPLLTSIIILLPPLTSILTAGIGRFVLAAYAKDDDRGITQIVSTMFPLLLGLAVIILAGGWVFAWHIGAVLSVPAERLWDARVMMALLVFSAALKPPCMAFSVGFYVQQRFLRYNLVNVGSEFLRVLVLFILLFGVSTRVLWVVVANAVADLAMSTVVLVWSRRMIPALRFRIREIQWSRARELVSFGGWSSLGYMAYRMREMIILMIMNRSEMPLEVAAYNVAVFNVGYQGRRQIEAWSDVMTGPLYPVVTSMHALGAKDRVRAFYLRGGRIALWGVLLVALPAMIYAETIIRLYVGPAYLEAAVVMLLTLASLPVTGGAWMIWQVANATGRVRATNLYVLALQVSTVALTYYTVHVLRWGATGVALTALAVGILPEFLVLWPVGLKLAGATFGAWVRRTLIPGLAPGCLAGVVWAALAVIVEPESWLSLGVCTLAGMLCYLVVLLAFCLEPQDREDLNEVRARLRNFTRSHWGAPPRVPTVSGGIRLAPGRAGVS